MGGWCRVWLVRWHQEVPLGDARPGRKIRGVAAPHEDPGTPPGAARAPRLQTNWPNGTLEDRRDGAAVDRPGGADDVAGELRAQERDHRGDLLGRAEPAERKAPGDRTEGLVAAHPVGGRRLVGEPALPQPQLALDRAGVDGVDEDPAG